MVIGSRRGFECRIFGGFTIGKLRSFRDYRPRGAAAMQPPRSIELTGNRGRLMAYPGEKVKHRIFVRLCRYQHLSERDCREPVRDARRD
jgi:hypothetical protein